MHESFSSILHEIRITLELFDSIFHSLRNWRNFFNLHFFRTDVFYKGTAKKYLPLNTRKDRLKKQKFLLCEKEFICNFREGRLEREYQCHDTSHGLIDFSKI
jgi:hypothetical protein